MKGVIILAIYNLKGKILEIDKRKKNSNLIFELLYLLVIHPHLNNYCSLKFFIK